jgi:hypothetical protein
MGVYGRAASWWSSQSRKRGGKVQVHIGIGRIPCANSREAVANNIEHSLIETICPIFHDVTTATGLASFLPRTTAVLYPTHFRISPFVSDCTEQRTFSVEDDSGTRFSGTDTLL